MYRYRLGHLGVAEMLLNVQSKVQSITKGLWEMLFIHRLYDVDNYKEHSSRYSPEISGINKSNGIFKRSYSTLPPEGREVDEEDLTVVLDEGKTNNIKNQVNA